MGIGANDYHGSVIIGCANMKKAHCSKLGIANFCCIIGYFQGTNVSRSWLNHDSGSWR